MQRANEDKKPNGTVKQKERVMRKNSVIFL